MKNYRRLFMITIMSGLLMSPLGMAGSMSPPKRCKVLRTDPFRCLSETSSALSNGSRMRSAPLVSLNEAREYFDTMKSSQAKDSQKWFVIPWGQEQENLSFGLGCRDDYQTADPVKIYEFVRNHIDYEPSFGFVKGGEMTLIDRSGNAFDQCSLLLDLLMIAGYDADYVYGVIHLDGAQFTSWMGIEDDPVLAFELLSDAGIPAEVFYTGDHIDYVNMQHMWVKWWDPENPYDSYSFDPSFKEYQVSDGVDIGTAMGYNATEFLNHAADGMTLDPDYIQNMNRANIRSDLASYSSSLFNYIETNYPESGMIDIIGGREIIPVTGQPLQVTLPYEQTRIYEYNGYHEGRDQLLTTWVIITYQGYDHYFPAYDLYGERLTLSFTENSGLYTANLFHNGYLMNDMPVIDPSESLQIYIDHPYMASGGTYQDDVGFVSPKPDVDHLYCFTFGFGRTGPDAINKHRKAMQEFMLDPSTPDSEPDPVLGEGLAIVGLTWMAQTSRAEAIGDALAGTRTIRHHSCGVIGQEDSPMMDLPMSSTSIAGTDSDIKFARFFTRFVTNSAFEGGTIAQMHDGPGASTVSLLDLANIQSNKIFNADDTNYSTAVRPQLQGYSTEYLNALDTQIANGDRLIIPEYGNLQMSDYTGTGYYCFSPDNYFQSLIMGGLNGGIGTQGGLLDTGSIAADQKEHENAEDHVQSNEPIDMLTGFYLISNLDLNVGEGSMPFGIPLIRFYNSGACKKSGPFGLGWSHNLDAQITTGSDGFRGMGAMSPFDAAPIISALFVASDIFDATLPVNRVLLSTTVNQWLMENLIDNVVNISSRFSNIQFVRMPDSSFNPQPDKWAQLETETDSSFLLTTKNGTKLDFALDGTLSTWQDLNSNTVTFSYSLGNLSSVDNGLGKSVHFNYNAQQRISSVTDHTGREVTYTYDTDGNLQTVTDPEENETRYEYDKPGRLTHIFHPSDPVTPYVINTYIEDDSITHWRYSPMQVIFQNDPFDKIYSYYYAAGRIAEEIDPLGNSHVLCFNEQGKLSKSIHSAGFETSYTYDGLGRLVKTTLPQGNGFEFILDNRGNVTELRVFPKTGSSEDDIVSSFTYNAILNRISQITDPLNRVTDYHYDSLGNLTSLELPVVETVRPTFSFTVNSRGQVTAVNGPEGFSQTAAYDPVTAEQVSSTIDPAGLYITTGYAYDAAGNVSFLTDPRGNSTTFYYNGNRQLAETISAAPFAYQTLFEYDVDSNPTRLRRATGDMASPWQEFSADYNLGGMVSATTDPLEHLTTLEYNDNQLLWKVTSADNHVHEYLYDSMNRPYRQINALGHIAEEHAYADGGRLSSVKDAKSQQTTFQFDDFDRLYRENYADGTYRQYSYDAVGNITQVRTRSGDTIDFTYDALNRRTSKITPDQGTILYDFDGLSRLTSITDDSGTIGFGYDNASRVTSVTNYGGKTIIYEYDAAGNRTGLTYPDGYKITYTYDNLNRLTDIHENNGVDLLVHYTYDALSRRVNTLCGNTVATDFSYLADNSVDEINYHFNGETVDFYYAYNDIGLLTSMNASNPDFLFTPSLASVTAFTPNNLNQYVDVNGQTYQYDDNGNLVSDGVNSYQYNLQNKLTSVTTFSDTITYNYNSLGQRIGKDVNGVQVSYVHDGLHLLAEYDNVGNLSKRYIYGPGLDDLVLTQLPGDRYYFHQDRIRSVVALSDSSGNRVETCSYSPEGEPSMASGMGSPFMYTGREYDAETGLYYFRNRYYSPGIGRFLSADPLDIYGGDLNLYTYARNSFPNFLDPLGLCTEESGDHHWWNYWDWNDIEPFPDYITAGGNFSVYGWGGGIYIVFDRHGQIYYTTTRGLDRLQVSTAPRYKGDQRGMPKAINVSTSIVGGYLISPDKSLNATQDFLIGDSTSIGFGEGVYSGLVQSSNGQVAIEVGGGTGLNASKGNTKPLLIYHTKEYYLPPEGDHYFYDTKIEALPPAWYEFWK